MSGCRAPFTHRAGRDVADWRRSLGPFAENVAHVLGAVMAGKYHPATPLTSARIKAPRRS